MSSTKSGGFGLRLSRKGRRRLSKRVRLGNSESSCDIYEICPFATATDGSWPLILTFPSLVPIDRIDGVAKSSLSRVVFPQPEGPVNTMNPSPSTWIETLLRAGFPFWYANVRFD